MTAPRAFIPLADGIAMVPLAGGRVASCGEVRRAMAEWNPEVVALEVPRVLGPEFARLLSELPRIALLAFRPEGEHTVYFIPNDPCDGVVEAARLATEFGIRIACVDIAAAGAGTGMLATPDVAVVARLGAAVWGLAVADSIGEPVIERRHRVIAGRLARTARGSRVLFAGDVALLAPLRALLGGKDAADLEDEDPAERLAWVGIEPVDEGHLAHVLGELPYLAYLYENFRSGASPEESFSVEEGLGDILHVAADRFRAEYDETINMAEWRALFQYGRNLALLRGRLEPRLRELITAARGCVDDDFGAICLEVAASYPPQSIDTPDGERSRPQTTHLVIESDEGQGQARPAYPRHELSMVEFRFRRTRPSKRERRKWSEKWQQDFLESFASGICSWPPEDERIEAFFRFLREKAKQSLSDDHLSVEEFSTSVLDGLDLRETLRRAHEGKLFVRRERQPPGSIGPVVLLFRDVPLDDDNLWRTTLFAENQNESDIAIYTTPLGRDMVGPGISRSEYLGVLSVYPAEGIPDVWSMPWTAYMRTHGRVLIASALLLSRERYVAVISDARPDADLYRLGRELKVAIVHLPLRGFSRKMLRRLRQLHILASKDARGWAGDYIG